MNIDLANILTPAVSGKGDVKTQQSSGLPAELMELGEAPKGEFADILAKDLEVALKQNQQEIPELVVPENLKVSAEPIKTLKEMFRPEPKMDLINAKLVETPFEGKGNLLVQEFVGKGGDVTDLNSLADFIDSKILKAEKPLHSQENLFAQNKIVKTLSTEADAPVFKFGQTVSSDEFLSMRAKAKKENSKEPNLEIKKIKAQNLKSETTQVAEAKGEQKVIKLKDLVLDRPIDGLDKNQPLENAQNFFNEVSSRSEVKMAEQQPAKILDFAKLTQTLDLSKVPQNEVIGKISDYIQQQSLQSRDRLDLTVSHQDLGQFQVVVNKGKGMENIDLMINASDKGHKFFVEHEAELVKNLQQSGIKLGDVKIGLRAEQIVTAKSFDSQNSLDSSAPKSQDMAYQLDRDGEASERRDSERRRELWREYRERFSEAS